MKIDTIFPLSLSTLEIALPQKITAQSQCLTLSDVP